MTYLLAITIGPVQDFIAASRRTADLQAGSRLLVEVARAIALTVRKQIGAEGQLIFPSAPERDGPNKILARTNAAAPETIVAAARLAAQTHIQQEWTQQFAILQKKGLSRAVDTHLAAMQLEDFLEFYAAWVPLGNDYELARQEVDRLLAGRKALRHFSQLRESEHQTRTGRPKSPLDPSRDCALNTTPNGQVPEGCERRPLWLKPRETLDAVSLLKRIKGVEESNDTPSTSFMAVQALLPELERQAQDNANVEDALNTLRALQQSAGTGADLGDFFFPARLEELTREKNERDAPRLDKDDIARVKRSLQILLKALDRSELPPYYAILRADGDRMGQLLGKLRSEAGHLACSQALTAFAEEARDIVTAQYGHCIYTGGDDVLALLPVSTALPCAARLAAAFRTGITRMASEHGLTLDTPEAGGTLSVGIAIVHQMDPLVVSLRRASEAEHAAKENRTDDNSKGRNSLAVALYKRSGEALICADSWSATPSLSIWKPLILAMTDDLARGFPYELRKLARECREVPLPPDLLPKEAVRILERKIGGAKTGQSEAVSNLRAALEIQRTPDALEAFAKRLVIARFFADYPTALQALVEEETPHA